jgi:thiamine pyrophosphate-dependent acetolactate synthase large subunit-like protein
MTRNYPTDLALMGDVREGLRDLNDAIDSLLTAARRRKIAEPRHEKLLAATSEARARAEAAAKQNFGASPMHPDELGAALAAGIDPEAIVVTENLTGRYGAFRFGHREGETMRVGNTGNGLGWGVGAATGAKIAAPDREVICSIGDGSVMYSASGFWSQARYSVPVLTVVWNNKNYQTVRHAYYRYKGKMAEADRYTGMYLGDPDINFVELAHSQGVAGEKAVSADQLPAAIARGRRAIKEGKPYLIDAEISRYGGGAESIWHQKFSLAERRSNNV